MVDTWVLRNCHEITKDLQVLLKKGRKITVPLPNFPYVINQQVHGKFHVQRKPQGTARAHIDTKRCHISPSISQHGLHTETPQWELGWGWREEEGWRGGGTRWFLGHHVHWTQKSGFGTDTRNNCSSVWWILKTCEENCSNSEGKRKWRKADNDILYIHWTLLLPGKYLSMK